MTAYLSILFGAALIGAGAIALVAASRAERLLGVDGIIPAVMASFILSTAGAALILVGVIS